MNVDPTNESDAITTAAGDDTDLSTFGDNANGGGRISAGGLVGIVVGVCAAIALLFVLFIAAIFTLKSLASWKPNEAAIRRATHYRTSTKKRSSTFKEQTVSAANSDHSGIGTERGRLNRPSSAGHINPSPSNASGEFNDLLCVEYM